MVELGDKVKDTVSGFEGIAIGEYKFLNGCRRIGVQPPVDKDGKLPESQTFDEPQLKVLKRAKPAKPAKAAPRHKSGGPMPYEPKGRPGPH